MLYEYMSSVVLVCVTVIDQSFLADSRRSYYHYLSKNSIVQAFGKSPLAFSKVTPYF